MGPGVWQPPPWQALVASVVLVLVAAGTPAGAVASDAGSPVQHSGRALSAQAGATPPLDRAAATASPAEASAEVALVDTLGAAVPSTVFSVFGSAGISILTSQHTGPAFTLQVPMTLTEIGAILAVCGSGAQPCRSPQPFVVDVRPARGGLPDPQVVLGSYLVPTTGTVDPRLAAYHEVRPALRLQAGTYFALFRPQRAQDEGYIVGTAQVPFAYVAGTVPLGVLFGTGEVRIEADPAAVRILAVAQQTTGKDQCLAPGAMVISGQHGTVVVAPGRVVCLLQAQINGSVLVLGGGFLFVEDSTIDGALDADSPAFVGVCGSTITRAVLVRQAAGLVLIGDPRADACGGNTMGRAVALLDNYGGVHLAANRIGRSLVCSGNVPPPTNDGQPNSVVEARVGQCAGL